MQLKKFKTLFVCFSLSIFLLSGCSIFGFKKNEIGQTKVKAVPTETVEQKEVTKEAAQYVSTQLKIANIMAAKENVSSNLSTTISNSSTVADSLSYTLGRPLYPYSGSPDILAARLDRLEAKLDEKLEKYAKQIEPLVGKKIEGTGLFQFSPITAWFGLIIFGGLVYFGLRIYSIFNPAVSVGLAPVRMSLGLLQKAATQTFKGIESFKESIVDEFEDPKTQQKIKDLLSTHLETAHDEDVKNAIKKLT